MALIDVDKVISGMQAILDEKPQDKGTPAYYAFEAFIERLKEEPTVDAVKVVRCEECKHLNVVNRKELYAHCPKTNTVFLPFELDTREHFCSLGERKEGAD